MAIWNRIKRLSIKQFFILFWVFVKRPQYIYATHKATIQSIQISKKYFPKKHHKHGRENAFRHALWNVLIAKNCYKPNRNPQDVVDWAEKVTTLHEKLAPNKPLETAMDLHNNHTGRQIFLNEKLYEKSIEEINAVLLESMQYSVKVENVEKIADYPDRMVHIES